MPTIVAVAAILGQRFRTAHSDEDSPHAHKEWKLPAKPAGPVSPDGLATPAPPAGGAGPAGLVCPRFHGRDASHYGRDFPEGPRGRSALGLSPPGS